MTFNVFISWSEARSHTVAKAMTKFLPRIVQRAEPFLSSQMPKGDRWQDGINSALETCRIGIVCLTPENILEPWILFESGALAGRFKRAVCGYLIGLDTHQLGVPLSQFQLTHSTRQETLELVKTVNEHMEHAIPREVLESAFEVAWPQFEEVLNQELAKSPTSTPKPATGTADAMFKEILDRLRGLDDSSGGPFDWAVKRAAGIRDAARLGQMSVGGLRNARGDYDKLREHVGYWAGINLPAWDDA